MLRIRSQPPGMIARRVAIVCSAALLAVSSAPEAGAQSYRWPIDVPKRVTSTFGEFRSTRFHHGLDVSTGGKRGFRVVAAERGYVSAVMYENYGIGYAVFVRHPDGRTTFYGHMDRFADGILANARVRRHIEHIRNHRDFRVDFSKPEIPLRRGTPIGYSGDSGAGLEHFHFEVRDKNNVHLNPLRYALWVPDATAPVIETVYLTPLDRFSRVDGTPGEKAYRATLVNRKEGRYVLAGNAVPRIAGRVGVKARVHDTVGWRNKVTAYGFNWYVDGVKRHRLFFDKIVRAYTHRMGLIYDYDTSNSRHFTFYLYARTSGDGVINAGAPGGTRRARAEFFDARLNRSIIEFSCRAEPPAPEPAPGFDHNLVPGSALVLTSADGRCTLSFPDTAALYPEMVAMEQSPLPQNVLSGLPVLSARYAVTPTHLCIDSTARIRIAYDGADHRTVGIYSVNAAGTGIGFVSNSYHPKERAFYATVRRMGRYVLARDEIPPVIRHRNPKRPRPNTQLRFTVSDRGSGVDLSKISLAVDGKSVFWYFDVDYRAVVILPHNPIWAKGAHTVTMTIVDRAGNRSAPLTYEYEQ